MDRQLPPERVREILDEAHRSPDLPAGRLTITAQAIRDALRDSQPPGTPPAFMGVGRPAPWSQPGPRPARRGRARLALVAATLGATVLLTAAIAGALPAPIQNRVAGGAAILGIDLPTDRPGPEVRLETPAGDPGPSPARGSGNQVDGPAVDVAADPAGADRAGGGAMPGKDSSADHGNGLRNDAAEEPAKPADPGNPPADPRRPGSGNPSQGGKNGVGTPRGPVSPGPPRSG